MDTKIFNLNYCERRKLSSLRKRTLFFYGIILILIGLFGLYKSDFRLNPFWSVLTIGGVLNIIYSVFGKEILKENNYISIGEENIEYKNSFKKPHNIKRNNLYDLRIETAKVEFVHNDQRVDSYDFSVFKREERGVVCQELERIKLDFVK